MNDDGAGTSRAERPDGAPLRLLVIAAHPFRLDDLDVGGIIDIDRATLVRRPGQIPAAWADVTPDLVVVDTAHLDDGGIAAIEQCTALGPDIGILAIASDPPHLEEVAPAIRAGARGFVDLDAPPHDVADAMRTVRSGGLWLPATEVQPLLSEAGVGVALTTAERRSRLTGILVGLIPLTGLVAALMAYLWRKYTGQIGVRPVDIAVDPTSRIVDAIVGLSLLLGAFGPLLFIGTWLDLARGSPFDRGPIGWLLRHRRLAGIALAGLWLVFAWLTTRGPDPLLVMVVGPTVALAIIARATGLDDQLPRFLRIKAPPTRVLVVGVAALLLFVAALGGEALFIGPELGTRGEGGIVVPRVIGFNAQPVEAFNVNTGDPPRQLLYLGGNADLYVLVDPCNDNEVEYVSVGAHRLVVIDEITCDPPSTG